MNFVVLVSFLALQNCVLWSEFGSSVFFIFHFPLLHECPGGIIVLLQFLIVFLLQLQIESEIFKWVTFWAWII